MTHGHATEGQVPSNTACDIKKDYPNLSHCDFQGADLTGAYLASANLTGANFMRADLTGAYLPEANLEEANLTMAQLLWADLTGANLNGAKNFLLAKGTCLMVIDQDTVFPSQEVHQKFINRCEKCRHQRWPLGGLLFCD